LRQKHSDALDKRAVTPEPHGKETDGEAGAPWENRPGFGLWSSIISTVKAVLFSPGEFFASLPKDAGMREPLAFGILTGSVGLMFSLFWQSLVLLGSLLPQAPALLRQFAAALLFLAFFLFVPVFVSGSVFVYSAILHLLLRIVRGGSGGFEASFRVVAYSQAAQTWGLIPFVGSWIGGIWQLIVQIVGLRGIHETTYARVILAFMIPFVAIILFIVLVVFPLLAHFLN
jgi:hypothetical protein